MGRRRRTVRGRQRLPVQAHRRVAQLSRPRTMTHRRAVRQEAVRPSRPRTIRAAPGREAAPAVDRSGRPEVGPVADHQEVVESPRQRRRTALRPADLRAVLHRVAGVALREVAAGLREADPQAPLQQGAGLPARAADPQGESRQAEARPIENQEAVVLPDRGYLVEPARCAAAKRRLHRRRTRAPSGEGSRTRGPPAIAAARTYIRIPLRGYPCTSGQCSSWG